MSDSTNRTLPTAVGLRPVHQPSVVTVGADGRAAFRLRAPGVETVQVMGKGGDSALGTTPHELKRGAEDWWSGEIGPIARLVRDRYFDAVRGRLPEYQHWLTAIE